MSRNTFIVFGMLVVVLVVLIPWLAFRADGDSAEGADVPAALQDGKELFQENCGSCHTLYAAGTDGNFGPDLDELLAPSGPIADEAVEATQGRVLNAVEEGIDSDTVPGRMPGGILTGEQAEAVAEFVARTAGRG